MGEPLAVSKETGRELNLNANVLCLAASFHILRNWPVTPDEIHEIVDIAITRAIEFGQNPAIAEAQRATTEAALILQQA